MGGIFVQFKKTTLWAVRIRSTYSQGAIAPIRRSQWNDGNHAANPNGQDKSSCTNRRLIYCPHISFLVHFAVNCGAQNLASIWRSNWRASSDDDRRPFHAAPRQNQRSRRRCWNATSKARDEHSQTARTIRKKIVIHRHSARARESLFNAR